MSREIKFRIWDGHAMRYPVYSLRANSIGRGACGIEQMCKDFSCVYPEKCVIQQFIGRIDNKGEEIYEGDIVSIIELEGDFNPRQYWSVGREIYYDGEQVRFLMRYLRQGIIIPYMASHIKILGNIFENQDLLGQSPA